MRASLIAASLALGLAAGPLHAQQAGAFDPVPAQPPIAPDATSVPPPLPQAEPGTVPDLAANCEAGLAAYHAQKPDVHIGQCSGFIDAVMQDLMERAAKGDHLGICLAGNVNELDTISQFLLWAKRHPEPIQSLDGLRASLREAYPCPVAPPPVAALPKKGH